MPGPRVLIIEDEMLVAMLVEDMLEELGYEVAGHATRLPRALELARDAEFDVAILDVNLVSEESFPVAQLLRERGIPFVFATGYGNSGLNENFRGSVSIQKPFEIHELEAALTSVLGS